MKPPQTYFLQIRSLDKIKDLAQNKQAMQAKEKKIKENEILMRS